MKWIGANDEGAFVAHDRVQIRQDGLHLLEGVGTKNLGNAHDTGFDVRAGAGWQRMPRDVRMTGFQLRNQSLEVLLDRIIGREGAIGDRWRRVSGGQRRRIEAAWVGNLASFELTGQAQLGIRYLLDLTVGRFEFDKVAFHAAEFGFDFVLERLIQPRLHLAWATGLPVADCLAGKHKQQSPGRRSNGLGESKHQQ